MSTAYVGSGNTMLCFHNSGGCIMHERTEGVVCLLASCCGNRPAGEGKAKLASDGDVSMRCKTVCGTK